MSEHRPDPGSGDRNDVPTTSGGGIVFGGRRTNRDDGARAVPDFARDFRRRWPTGVAVATVRTASGDLRGVAISSLMMLSLDPPLVALALDEGGTFHELLGDDGIFALSILDRDQEFLSERFAGRAPVPDTAFGGIPFDLVAGDLPVLRGALGWCRCRVTDRSPQGDHILVIACILDGDLGPDTDDPLLSYEGQYRGLEMR
ncbi:MAG TPA: flavin reductase family protein [Thermomicrobiales bacterium]|nr:flavin reductase family protein [Thermomicrobiales bacterium]